MTWNPIQGEINATCLQVCRAHEAYFGTPIPPGVAVSEVARNLIIRLGVADAKALIEGQSNEPYEPEPEPDREEESKDDLP